MSATRVTGDTKAIVGVGVMACAVCCAGPILGFLAAIGLGTALGAVLWGIGGLLVGALVAVVVIVRRRRPAATCVAAEPQAISVALSSARTRR